jgi:NAD(P)-dependent dehydrogenase (short-subunit alcohol dehydrogenase family)
MRLQGKIVFITGGTRGIGAVLSQRVAEQGSKVVIAGRSVDTGERLAQEIVAGGGEATFVRMDVSREADVAAAITTATEIYGGVDVLVNNAGPTDLLFDGTEKRVHELTTDGFEAILRIGLYGPFWCCKYVIPEMTKVGGGSIVNMASMAAVVGLPASPSYTVCKGALTALTRQIAVDYADAGIRSNVIILGLIIHETTQAVVATPELEAAFRKLQLTRLGVPDDVAHAVIYLASDESAFVTGSTMTVDGGTLIKAGQPTDEMFLAIDAQS